MHETEPRLAAYDGADTPVAPVPSEVRSGATGAGFAGADRLPRPPADDADLLAACRLGDAEAWDQIVTRYERLVFSVARRNGLSDDDAADVCQVTFVALLESIDMLRDDTQLASWLMTVARRHAWRSRSRQQREHPVPLVPDTAGAEPDDWERVADLHHALGRLDEPCRTLIIGLYLDADEPSYTQLAARLGRAVGGIGPLRGRCLHRLRSLLEDPPDAAPVDGRVRRGGLSGRRP